MVLNYYYQHFFIQQQFQIMKKQFFDKLSAEFPNELNCSSIRINAEQQEQAAPRRKDDRYGNQLNSGPKLKKYEQNDIVGFQMSLQMDDNRQNFLQLMRSKSLRELNHSKQLKQKLQHSKRQKQQIGYGGSLYNTSSFDEMTMNITTNTRLNNQTNIHNNTDSFELQKNIQRTLKKPTEMVSLKEAYFDEKITININKQKQNIKIVDEEDRKPPSALLQALKLSITEEQNVDKQVQQPSFDGPYFKVGSVGHLNTASKIEPEANKLFVQDHKRSNIKKVTSVDTIKSSDPKKLTLRDYMYLSKLSNKTREKGSFCQQAPQSPQFARSTVTTSRSRKKLPSSNTQVMQQLKKQVMKNIQLVQGNMNLLLQYIGTTQIDDQVSNGQLMNMYNLARILKDKIVNGNDELVMMLQQANRE